MRPAMNDQSPGVKSNGKPQIKPKSTDSAAMQVSTTNSVTMPKRSILKKSVVASKNEPDRGRNDSAGNKIKHGSKKHKLVFKENLCEVIEVESYKEYNAEEEPQNGKTCCNIF